VGPGPWPFDEGKTAWWRLGMYMVGSRVLDDDGCDWRMRFWVQRPREVRSRFNPSSARNVAGLLSYAL
jgi:hypothetical protein